MTNKHLLENKKQCQGHHVQFHLSSQRVVKLELDPGALFITNIRDIPGRKRRGLDFTIVALKPSADPELEAIFQNPIRLEKWSSRTPPAQALIWQHPHGGEKVGAYGHNAVVDFGDPIVSYQTQTESGSSGSPVHAIVNRALRLFALNCSHETKGFQRVAKGINVNAIIRYLEVINQYGTVMNWVAPFRKTIMWRVTFKSFEQRRKEEAHRQAEELFLKAIVKSGRKQRRLLQEAAEKGHRHAQYWLGCDYQSDYDKPDGVEEDRERAVFWFKKAAEQGVPDAQNEVAIYYEQEGNDREALIWYRRAAENGQKDAIRNLFEQWDSYQLTSPLNQIDQAVGRLSLSRV